MNCTNQSVEVPSPPNADTRTTATPEFVIYCAALVLLVVFSVPWFISNPINGDTGFFIYSGKQILDGASLYRDIIEPNAPPPYLFGLATTAMGRLLGLTPETAFVVCLTVLICLSVCRCYCILKRLYQAIPYAAPLLTLAITYCLLPYVKDKFGEREHILTVMVLPWLLASVSDSESRSRRAQLVDGVMAAVGIAMKPYFMALYGCVQLMNLVTERRRAQLLRQDNLVIGISQAASAIATLVFVPDYLFVVRFALTTYHNFRKTLLVVCSHPTFVLFVAVTLVSLKFRSGHPFSQIRNFLLTVGWSMAAVVLYQREGFGYHYYPLGVLAVLALTSLLLDWMDTTGVRVKRWTALFFVAFVTARGVDQGTRRLDMPKMTGPLVPVVLKEARGKPILVLSTSLWAGSPLINYTETTSAWRFRSLWPLGGFYPERPSAGNPHPYRSRAEMGEYERYFLDSLVEDTLRHPPQLIIVEIGSDKEGFRNGDFDYLDYFLHDDRFERFFRGYDKLADITRYRVFRRR